MKYPDVQFRAGELGTLHTNVNFARQEAERETARTGKVTTLYQVRNGSAMAIQQIKPEKLHPYFHEIWAPEVDNPDE